MLMRVVLNLDREGHLGRLWTTVTSAGCLSRSELPDQLVVRCSLVVTVVLRATCACVLVGRVVVYRHGVLSVLSCLLNHAIQTVELSLSHAYNGKLTHLWVPIDCTLPEELLL